MAGKFGKFLVFSAAVGAFAAATYYYLQKKDQPIKHPFDSEDDDFDDFAEEDLDEDMSDRSYVTLTSDSVSKTVKKAAGEAKDIAQYAYEGAKAAFQDAKDSFQMKWDTMPEEKDLNLSGSETVEEFFDDDEDLEQIDIGDITKQD